MMYKTFSQFLVIACALPLTTIVTDDAVAQEDDPVYDTSTERCINMRRIRRTEIVDDRNILFYMGSKVVYHNILPARCHGLAREDRFSYQTRNSRLCEIDRIKVLQSGAFGLQEGIACRLGPFHEITREDAEAFLEGPGNQPDRDLPPMDPLPVPEPQEVGTSSGGEPSANDEPSR